MPRQEKDKGEQFAIIWSWHGSQTRASGGYYFNDINEDVTKLGIGDMNKIIKDEKILIEVTFNKETEFLKSRSVNIEDWNDTGEVFEGGVIQYFNNKAKSNIDKSLTKVIKRYGQ